MTRKMTAAFLMTERFRRALGRFLFRRFRLVKCHVLLTFTVFFLF